MVESNPEIWAEIDAALAKGISLFLMGAWVFGSTIYRVFYVGIPEAEIMGIIGALALGTNLASVFLLVSYKDGDANVRSVWICSRNDAIGNRAYRKADRRGGSGAVKFT